MKIQNSGNLADIMKTYSNNSKPITEEEFIFAEMENNNISRKKPYYSDVAELFKDLGKAEALAKKAVRGEALTAEEREFLNRVDPELLKKAEQAKEEAESLKIKLQSSKTDKETNNAISYSNTIVTGTANYDMRYASLLGSAFNNVINKYAKGSRIEDILRKIQQ